MFRTDRDALAEKVDELRRERAELQAQNDAMRTDLLARRQQQPLPVRGPSSAYRSGTSHLTPGEQVALRQHEIKAFPVWAAVLLHFVTFGLFSLIHFFGMHGKLPRAEQDDPGAGKAIGFSLIPYFNVYWVVFSTLRLADRINLQFRLRGLPDQIPRGLAMAAAVLSVVPYVNLVLGLPIFMSIAVGYFQRAANRLAALDREGAEAPASAARVMESTGEPHLRVPLVKDLPGPDEVVLQEAEAEADEALRRRDHAR